MGKRLGSEGFGRRLKQARLQLGTNRLATLGQEELGGLLGVTGVTIGRWEEGNREPGSLALLERLAAILRVSPGWLAFGEVGRGRADTDEPLASQLPRHVRKAIPDPDLADDAKRKRG